ncbi:MAG TPA: DUF1876 domain-containing protein [Euzebyales bacterium]|nr:DUF1876 domain-containing protein [Euzebyales bacterium]
MQIAKQWSVDIYLTELSDAAGVRTHAEARLHTQDATDLRGRGDARKHPADRDVPEIGDELAAARALSDLAHQLLHAAAEDIEGVTGTPVTKLDA